MMVQCLTHGEKVSSWVCCGFLPPTRSRYSLRLQSQISTIVIYDAKQMEVFGVFCDKGIRERDARLRKTVVKEENVIKRDF